MSQVRVRLKKDPSRVRMMTARSFEVNRSKWELAPEEGTDPNDQSDIAIEISRSKKKGVSGAVTADSDHRIGTTKEEFQIQRENIREQISGGRVEKTEFVDVNELGNGEPEVKRVDLDTFKKVNEEFDETEKLRDEYAIKFGKPADKRWKAERIKSELEKLTQQ